MVNRSEYGTYEIPGAAEVEAWADVVAATTRQTHHGPLKGWGEWRHVYCVADADGNRSWYFVGGESEAGNV
ncbi:MAG: hypothetical protein GWN87_32060 [Desulfuromonadales bacterium]|nr:hypothetical protein [Desulfuromonadales bacterium]